MALPVQIDTPVLQPIQYHMNNLPSLAYSNKMVPGQEQYYPDMVCSLLNQLCGGFGKTAGRSLLYNVCCQNNWNNQAFIGLVQLGLDILSISTANRQTQYQAVHNAADKAIVYTVSQYILITYPELQQMIDQNSFWSAKSNLDEFNRITQHIVNLRQQPVSYQQSPYQQQQFNQYQNFQPVGKYGAGYYIQPAANVNMSRMVNGVQMPPQGASPSLYQVNSGNSQNTGYANNYQSYNNTLPPNTNGAYNPIQDSQVAKVYGKENNVNNIIVDKTVPINDTTKFLTDTNLSVDVCTEICLSEGIEVAVSNLIQKVLESKDKPENSLLAVESMYPIYIYSPSEEVKEIKDIIDQDSLSSVAKKLSTRIKEAKAPESGYLHQLNSLFTSWINYFLKGNIALKTEVSDFAEDIMEEGLMTYFSKNFNSRYVDAYRRYEKDFLGMLNKWLADQKDKIYEATLSGSLAKNVHILSISTSLTYVPVLSKDLATMKIGENTVVTSSSALHNVIDSIRKAFKDILSNRYMFVYIVTLDRTVYQVAVPYLETNSYYLSRVM